MSSRSPVTRHTCTRPGDGLLIGIGQDATEEGRTSGSQLSLFDVSDLANPKRLHQHKIGGSSEAEYDHHAFLWWAPTKLAVLPVQIYDRGDCCGEPTPQPQSNAPSSAFSGAIGLSVSAADGIREAGRTAHSKSDYDYRAQIRRSLVAGGRLFTLSDRGLKASSLDTLADQAFVEFE